MAFRRVDALPPYAFAEVERLKLELRRAGEDVIDFGFGNPDVPPEGRQYSCRASSGGSVVLVNQTTEPIASLDVAQG